MNRYTLKGFLFAAMSLLAPSAFANRSVMEGIAASNQTVYVDTVNVRVGISTAIPQRTLDVNGAVKLSSAIFLGNDPGTYGYPLLSSGTAGAFWSASGASGYSVSGVSVSTGLLANHWQVVASTYVVNNSSVSFYVPESFSSATWRFYTQGGMAAGATSSNYEWYVRFDNNSGANYFQSGVFMSGSGQMFNVGSGNGVGISGCAFQSSSGTMTTNVDSMEFSTNQFSPQAQNPGRINIGWAASYTYSGAAAQAFESGMCYVTANAAGTPYHTISIVPPVGYSGWVFLEKLFIPYR